MAIPKLNLKRRIKIKQVPKKTKEETNIYRTCSHCNKEADYWNSEWEHLVCINHWKDEAMEQVFYTRC